MSDECGVVAAGTQRADAQVAAVARLLSGYLPLRRLCDDQVRLLPLPDGDIFLGVGYVARNAVNEFFQRM
jgi:hypothetical protein